ncbi:hypothetical protein PENFLA_c001G08144 [Penicillium flavigenum]|uniref:Uncharacterized protein n=1 Tax=Penicillium flavigenum TaxID=254877 RepID=A0A1V6U376_9EURO|nr:hypothetical protein PENFLA_c001G08144 [Penicillium flavigenum]
MINTEAFVFFYAGSPISWSSRKEDIIARSSTSAEYIAFDAAVREAMWLHKIMCRGSRPGDRLQVWASQYATDAEYPPDEDPQACWQAPPPPFLQDEDDQPCYSVTEDVTPTATCLHCSTAFHSCSTAFQSNNKLHAHLKDCASKHTAAAIDDSTVAYYADSPLTNSTDALPPDLPVIKSDRMRTTQSGMAYKTWRYASTVVGLTTQHRLLVACLDTGCVMTIIDADLAKSLALPLQKCTPVQRRARGGNRI